MTIFTLWNLKDGIRKTTNTDINHIEKGPYQVKEIMKATRRAELFPDLSGLIEIQFSIAILFLEVCLLFAPYMAILCGFY